MFDTKALKLTGNNVTVSKFLSADGNTQKFLGFGGKVLTFSTWAYKTGVSSPTTNGLKVVIIDNQDARIVQNFHSGTGWEFIKSTIQTANNTQFGTQIQVTNLGTGTSCIVDGASVTFGDHVNNFVKNVEDDTTIGLHLLDPDGGFHTGTLQGKYVAIADVPLNIYSGTNAEQVFQEIGEWEFPPKNYLKNGSFEFWRPVVNLPYFYTLLGGTGTPTPSKETGTVRKDITAFKISGQGIYQYPSILTDYNVNDFANKVFTLGCWVFNTGVSGDASIAIANSPFTSLVFHSGTGWEYLRATSFIGSPSILSIQFGNQRTGTVSIFDGLSLTGGRHVTDFSPNGADQSGYAVQTLVNDVNDYFTGTNVEDVFTELYEIVSRKMWFSGV